MIWESSVTPIEIMDEEEDCRNCQNQKNRQEQNNESSFQKQPQEKCVIGIDQNNQSTLKNQNQESQPLFNTALAQQLLNQAVSLKQNKQGEIISLHQSSIKDDNQQLVAEVPSFQPPHISSRYAFLANQLQKEYPFEIDLTTQTKPMEIQQQPEPEEIKQVLCISSEDNKCLPCSQPSELTESDKKHMEQLKDMIKRNANLTALKEKIVRIIPELQGEINRLGQQEINQIYQTIRNEMRDQQLSKVKQKDTQILSQPIVNEANPTQLSTQLIQNQDQFSKAKAILQNQNGQFGHSSLQIKDQTKVSINQERESSKPEMDIATFKSLKNLNSAQLQLRLIEIFPMNRESLILMNEFQLLEIVQQIIDELQKEDKSKNESSAQKNPHSEKGKPIQNQQKAINEQINIPTQQTFQDQIIRSNSKVNLSVLGQKQIANAQKADSNKITTTTNEQTKSLRQRQEDGNYAESNDKMVISAVQKLVEPNKNSQKIMLSEVPLNFRQTLEIVVANFPELKQTLQKMSQEDIKSVYDEVMNSRQPINQLTESNTNKLEVGANGKKQALKSPEKPLQAELIPLKLDLSLKEHKNCGKTADSVIILNEESKQYENMGKSLKRTHSTMMSTNKLKSTFEGKPYKKKKINIADLRNRLIKRLPQLKNNIMKLDDRQIEKIFMETIDEQEAKEPKEMKGFEEMRPVIVLESKHLPFNKLNMDSEEVTSKKLFKNKNEKANTELVEVISKGKKRSRTLILVHSEDEDEDRKINKVANDCQKESNEVCNCKCCQKNSNQIPPIFQRIMKSMLNQ